MFFAGCYGTPTPVAAPVAAAPPADASAIAFRQSMGELIEEFRVLANYLDGNPDLAGFSKRQDKVKDLLARLPEAPTEGLASKVEASKILGHMAAIEFNFGLDSRALSLNSKELLAKNMDLRKKIVADIRKQVALLTTLVAEQASPPQSPP